MPSIRLPIIDGRDDADVEHQQLTMPGNLLASVHQRGLVVGHTNQWPDTDLVITTARAWNALVATINAKLSKETKREIRKAAQGPEVKRLQKELQQAKAKAKASEKVLLDELARLRAQLDEQPKPVDPAAPAESNGEPTPVRIVDVVDTNEIDPMDEIVFVKDRKGKIRGARRAHPGELDRVQKE